MKNPKLEERRKTSSYTPIKDNTYWDKLYEDRKLLTNFTEFLELHGGGGAKKYIDAFIEDNNYYPK